LEEKIDWEQVIAKASQEFVLSLLYKNLKRFSEKIPPSVMLKMKKSYYQKAAHSISIIHELKPVLKLIDEAGIQTAVIKGLRLSATLYKDLGLRPHMDVDLIVYPPHRKELAAVLEKMSFIQDDDSIREFNAKEQETLFWTYRPMFKKRDVLCEVHTNFPGLHIPFTLEKDLWAGIQKIKIDGVGAKALSDEYELCLLCLHVQQHSYSRLMWLTDIVEMAVMEKLDWEKMHFICSTEKIHAHVYYSLYLVNQLWQESIPDEILERFKLRKVEKKVLNFFWPEEKVTSRTIADDMPMHAPTFLALLSNKRLLLTTKSLFEFFFPPRIWVAYYYKLSPRSIKIVYHYLWRLFRPFSLVFRRVFRA
jgi:hypothetical protein